MQSVHGFRFQFPSHDGFLRARIAANPRVHKLSRRIDLEVFAFHVEFGAIRTFALAAPFTARTKVHRGLRHAIHTLLAPPPRELVGISNRLEHTGRRSSNEHLGDDSILIGGDCSGSHLRSLLEYVVISAQRSVCFLATDHWPPITFFSGVTTCGASQILPYVPCRDRQRPILPYGDCYRAPSGSASACGQRPEKIDSSRRES